MKKVLFILAICVFLNTNAYSEIKKWIVGSNSYSKGENPTNSGHIRGISKISLDDAKRKSLNECSKKYQDCIILYIATDKGFGLGTYKKEVIWKQEYEKYTKKIVKNKNSENEKKKQENIMFTIKDKREQCEAIGFKLETEKFAECVLRLVELDIKQQTQNQITVAQNNGNDALVKQLQRQNNLQSSQALIDLGQQLMNPKRYNSNIYLPQTQRCFMQGFGTFATMRCR
jgi:hypothetical protein